MNNMDRVTQARLATLASSTWTNINHDFCVWCPERVLCPSVVSVWYTTNGLGLSTAKGTSTMLKSILMSSAIAGGLLCSAELQGEASGGSKVEATTIKLPPAPSKKAMNEALDRLSKMHRTFCQSGEQFEAGLHEIAVMAVSYVKEHNDAVPADKIVKILYSDRKTQFYAFELITWFKRMSPVRWGASRDPMQAPVSLEKDKDGNIKPVDENAADLPFSKLAEVIASRNIARAAAQRSLKPFGVENVAGWVVSLTDKFKNAGKANDKGEVRGYVKGEKARTKEFIDALLAVVAEYTGEGEANQEADNATNNQPVGRLIKNAERPRKAA